MAIFVEMKKALTYVCIFLLLSVTAGKSLLYVNYLLQKKYIAAYLCENRNKPVLDCEGKCFLNKVMDEAGEQEKKINLNLESEAGLVTETDSDFLFDISLPSRKTTSYFSFQSNPLTGYLSAVFQPPA